MDAPFIRSSPQSMARLCSHVTYMSGDSWKQGNIDFTGEFFCSISLRCFYFLMLVALQGLTSIGKYCSGCIVRGEIEKEVGSVASRASVLAKYKTCLDDAVGSCPSCSFQLFRQRSPVHRTTP
jgi:hypothetical protein